MRAIKKEMVRANRANIVKACGAGKTLTGLWAAKALGSQKILVLVPSLGLLRQVRDAWQSQRSLPTLCVCSDSTVVGDDDLFNPEIPVSTKAEDVKSFLKSVEGPSVIYATYHSADIVAAGMPRGFAFDLGVFDEAHRTAGVEGRPFSFALSDRNIRIKKRLFMTATPRHCSPRSGRDGDMSVVYSMDDESIYGRRVYTLSFRDAVHLGVICDYQIIISVISSAPLAKAVGRREKTPVSRAADLVAVEKAMRHAGAKKAITFHPIIQEAADFAQEGQQHCEKGLSLFHVNGTMKVGARQEIFSQFKSVPRGVITNARCLSEGIDTPAVDMVAFMSRKKSVVDIVQTSGRAMRLDPENPAKNTGTILIPLHVFKLPGQSLEEALKTADYRPVFDILQAIKEQDTVLAGHIGRFARGETSWEESIGRKVTLLLPDDEAVGLNMDTLRKAISVRIVNAISESWDIMYAKLQAFKSEHGHCRPKYEHPNATLARWVYDQRALRRKGYLSKDQVKLLTAIGFIWNLDDVYWEEAFDGLKKFHAKHGHCRKPKPDAVCTWLSTQRRLERQGELSPDRKRRLESLGVEWDPESASWRERFVQLHVLYEKQGKYPDSLGHDPKLSQWVTNQRRKKRIGNLTIEQIEALDSIGFPWDTVAHGRNLNWNDGLAALRKYYRTHGHSNVERDKGHRGKRRKNKAAPDASSTPFLRMWMKAVRGARSEGRLTASQIAKLDALKFDWSTFDHIWEAKYEELKAHFRKHGHTRVSSIKYPKLAPWLSAQRLSYRRKTLLKERIELLNKLGIIWDPDLSFWEKCLADVVSFRKKYGSLVSPKAPLKDRRYHSAWLRKEWNRMATGKLSEEKVEKLRRAKLIPLKPYARTRRGQFEPLESFL